MALSRHPDACREAYPDACSLTSRTRTSRTAMSPMTPRMTPATTSEDLTWSATALPSRFPTTAPLKPVLSPARTTSAATPTASARLAVRARAGRRSRFATPSETGPRSGRARRGGRARSRMVAAGAARAAVRAGVMPMRSINATAHGTASAARAGDTGVSKELPERPARDGTGDPGDSSDAEKPAQDRPVQGAGAPAQARQDRELAPAGADRGVGRYADRQGGGEENEGEQAEALAVDGSHDLLGYALLDPHLLHRDRTGVGLDLDRRR